MKTQYLALLLAMVALLLSSACLIPEKIEEQASWAIIDNQEWEALWKDSPRDQTPRTFWDSTIEVDVTSRASAWFNQPQEAGALVLATPDISILGFSQNPFKTQSDEWVIREIARQGGSVAQEKLGIAYDPATIPLTLQETITVQSAFGATMVGSRFLAQTPEGDGYVAVLRTLHEKDVIVLVTASQTLAASRTSVSAASALRHPSGEPVIRVAAASEKGINFIKQLEGLHARPVEQPYNDSVGNCTIGYGHLIHKGVCNGHPGEEYFRDFIEQYGAGALFLQDLEERAMKHVRAYVTVPLSQYQFDALTSYTFNRGEGNLRLLVTQTQLNQGNYGAVPSAMLGAQHIPSTIPLLEGRRCDEAELFQSGDYTVQRRNPCPLKP